MATKKTLDNQTQSLLRKLDADPAIATLSQYLQQEEYDYALLAEELLGPPAESEIFAMCGETLFYAMKSIVCGNPNDATHEECKQPNLNMIVTASNPLLSPFHQLPHQQSIASNLSLGDSDIDDDENYALGLSESKQHHLSHCQQPDQQQQIQPPSTKSSSAEQNEPLTQYFMENAEMQSLVADLEQLAADKEAVVILVRLLHEQHYETIDTIASDLDDETNSNILDHLKQHNVTQSFCTDFCAIVRQRQSEQHSIDQTKEMDEWQEIQHRMLHNTSFTPSIYETATNYFRDAQWNVQSYREDEIGEEYENSYFLDIFPNMTDIRRKQLIKIFETAILNEQFSVTPNTTDQHSDHEDDKHLFPQYQPTNQHTLDSNHHEDNTSTKQTQPEEDEKHIPWQQPCNEQEGDIAAGEDGEVDQVTNARYRSNAILIDNCCKMLHSPSDQSQSETHTQSLHALKALCSVLDINNVLQIAEILDRQYLSTLYSVENEAEFGEKWNAFSACFHHITSQRMEILQKFIDQNYCKREHDETQFCSYIKLTFERLQTQQWLGYSIMPPMAGYFHCNAREVQVYVFAFLIGTSRMLIKNFEDKNVCIALELTFPASAYHADEGTLDPPQLIRKSLQEIQSAIIKFVECFENPQIRGAVRNKIEKRGAVMVHSVDFSKRRGSKARWNNLKLQSSSYLHAENIGFELSENEYTKRYDACELFQVLRVKRYAQSKTKNKGQQRICISLHKFGKQLKFYLHALQSMHRLQMRDLCEWFPRLFTKHDSALKWKDVQKLLSDALRDNEKLADVSYTGTFGMEEFSQYYNGDVVAKDKKANFWRNIRCWDDLDDDYRQKCQAFYSLIRGKK